MTRIKLKVTFLKAAGLAFSISLLLLFLSFNGMSQVSSKDGNSYSADTALINAYIKKAFPFSQMKSMQDSADYYLKKVFSLSKKRNFEKGITEYYRLKAVSYFITGQADSVSSSLDKAFYSASKSNDAKELALVNDLKAWIFQNLEQNDSAVYYYVKAAAIADSLHENKFSAEIYNNLSSIFWNIADYKNAERYGSESYKNAKTTKDTLLISNSLFNFGNAKTRLKQYDSALVLFDKIKELVTDLAKYNYVLFRAVSNEAAINSETGNYKEAIRKYQNILQNSGQIPEYLQSYIYSGLGSAQFENNQYKDAELNMTKAIQLAETGGVQLGLQDSYLIMSQIMEKQRQFESALDFRKKYDSLKDTLLSVSKTKFIHQLEAKYNSAQKTNQITAQELAISENKRIIEKKNTVNIALISGVFFLLIVGLLLFRNFRHRHNLLLQSQELKEQRITELEQERKLVAAQSVLKGQEEERSRLARDLHDGVGGLLSGVKLSMSNMKGNVFLSEENVLSFENVISQLDQSIAELRRVSHNMMPEALIKFGLKEALENYCENINFSGKINVRLQTYGMEKRMDQTTEIIIYRIIQELLNNVIKHADAKNVLIQLVREEEHFSLTVEDDGKGFDVDDSKTNSGAGLGNIKARAEYLNGNVDIVSKKGEGTSVTIEGSCI